MPDRLGRYELRGTLGKGAAGTVFDAWDTELDRRVAVKTLHLPADGDETAVESYARFKREAKTAAGLSHPGIVRIYDSGEVDGIAYIAMELVEGPSLKALLDQELRLPPDAAVRVMVELLDALSYSHAHKVIHRDIKPTNILMTPSGSLKIADFGIARIESSSMTQLGTVMGTPAYMSPEQFMGQAVDQRTDVYAAGVLLYHLLTGEKPFEGGLTAIMHKVLHTTPPRPSELSVTAPEAFDPVVARAMARRPEDRYPSAAAFSAALQAALAGGAGLVAQDAVAGPDADATLVTTAFPPARPAAGSALDLAGQGGPPPPPSPAPRRLRPALLGAAGVAAVLLLAGAYFGLRPSGQAPPPAPAPLAAAVSTPAPAPDAPPLQAMVIPPAGPQPQSADSTPALLPATRAPASVPPPEAPPSPAVATPVPAAAPPLDAPPAPVPPPAPPASAPNPVQPVSISPAPPAASPALADIACTLLDIGGAAEGRMSVSGLVGAGSPEAAARIAAQAAVGRGVLGWDVMRFNGPYCGVADTLRAIRSDNPPNAGGFDLSLRGGRTRLRNGEVMAPIITAPAFPAHLQLTYFQGDQTVVHLFPYTAAPDRILAPGSSIPLGDPKTGGWTVGVPFGTDLMVAVMSSVPLPMPPRPDGEPTASYLAALRRAGEAARREGATILVRTLVISTQR